MAQSFLGTGWSFPTGPAPGATSISWVSDEDKVRQSIWIVLSTAPGERLMQAAFGCGMQARVFDNLDDAGIGLVLADVASALATWEPRIDVVGLDAKIDPREANRLLISIDYVVRKINSRFNLVYPFYVS